MKNFLLGFLVCAVLVHFDSKAMYDELEYCVKRMDRLQHLDDQNKVKEVEAKIIGFKG